MASPPPEPEQPEDPPETTYTATVRPLDDSRRPTAVQRFVVREYRAGGWVAEATVDPRPGTANRNIVFEAFRDALADGLAPGSAAVLRLIASSDSESAPAVLARAWPSAVRQLRVEPTGDAAGNSIYKVELCDPVTYLSARPIWGAFHETPLGQIVGGALSLAVGGDGEPTLSPALPGLPRVHIETHLTPPAVGATLADSEPPTDYDVRYAIAVGEPLGLWLGKTLSRLGARMETEVLQDGGIRLHLHDDLPASPPLVMTFEAGGEASETNATLFELAAYPSFPSRGALQDNPTSDVRRIGDAGAVGQVITAAGIGVDEAAQRAGYAAETRRLAARTLHVTTKQPLVRPGWRMEFANRNVDGTNAWQMANVSHYFGSGGYRNLAYLQKDGDAWRPLIPPDDGPVVVSATVDDGESDPGEPVERDRLGRIPMRFGFLPRIDTPGAAINDGEESAAPLPPPTIARVPLPIIELMGGGQHGFVPAHRQGDLCRVLVHHPFFAEIYGFAYRDDRRVGANLADASAGLVVSHDADGFSGLLFRPDEDLQALRENADD